MKHDLLDSKRLLSTLLLSAGLVAAATPAGAIMIETWGYDISSGFIDYTPVADPVTDPYAVTGSGASSLGLPFVTELRWGRTGAPGSAPNPDLQSKLLIEDPVSGPPPDLETNGIAVDTVTLTHDNRVIFDFDRALVSTDLVVSGILTPLTPPPAPSPSLPALPVLFNITFEETLNANPACVVPSPPSLCGDIFVLLNPEELSFVIPEALIPAAFNDFTYTVFLGIEGLAPLTNAQCAAAGAPAGCQGLLTAENAFNAFDGNVRITAVPDVPVPEPGTLALLGLLFGGLSLVRFRTSKR